VVASRESKGATIAESTGLRGLARGSIMEERLMPGDRSATAVQVNDEQKGIGATAAETKDGVATAGQGASGVEKPSGDAPAPEEKKRVGAGSSDARKGSEGGLGAAAVFPGRKILTVASQSPVKQLAGSVAHISREAEPPVLSAVGPASVNQAVKSIAIARSYLGNDGIDLKVKAMRGQGGEIKDLILLDVSKQALTPPEQGLKFQELKCAAKSMPSELGGAIAKNVREDRNVKITAVGQNPVFRAVDGITRARKYLRDDQMDLDFQPSFTQVTFSNGTEANAVQLVVFSHYTSASTQPNVNES